MSSTTVHVTASGTMGIYEPHKQMSMWRDAPSSSSMMASPADVSSSAHAEAANENKFEHEYTSHQGMGPSITGEDAIRLSQKMERRLQQNREAAKRSRLRRKAYVQQLESSRLKLAQLEQELQRAKQQVGEPRVQIVCPGPSSHANVAGFARNNLPSGIAAFEIEYGMWVEEQNRQNVELTNALQANVSDIELEMLIDGCLNHYYQLFRIKADATRVDVFYMMSGTWRSTVERFFHWIGGFRPSKLLEILTPHLGPLSPQQSEKIRKLQQSSQQAEEALSRGVEKLQLTLSQIMFAEGSGIQMYGIQMVAGLEKLNSMEGFVNQADHLRELTLQLMSRILTPRQAARGLVALGEYFRKLRALSALWVARPPDSG